MSRPIRVAEIFGPTIQGEGPLIGMPSLFLRTGGCDDRCVWCDTPYAVLPEHKAGWQAMTAQQALDRLRSLSRPMLVTLTGGNPALQPLDGLIALGRPLGYSFAAETQGTAAPAWFADLDWLILSPKPPSAGVRFDPARLAACLAAAGPATRVVLKVVVMDEADYLFARGVATLHPEVPVYLQAGNPDPAAGFDRGAVLDRLRWLMERTAGDDWREVRVLPQLHTLAWGDRRGV